MEKSILTFLSGAFVVVLSFNMIYTLKSKGKNQNIALDSSLQKRGVFKTMEASISSGEERNATMKREKENRAICSYSGTPKTKIMIFKNIETNLSYIFNIHNVGYNHTTIPITETICCGDLCQTMLHKTSNNGFVNLPKLEVQTL